MYLVLINGQAGQNSWPLYITIEIEENSTISNINNKLGGMSIGIHDTESKLLSDDQTFHQLYSLSTFHVLVFLPQEQKTSWSNIDNPPLDFFFPISSLICGRLTTDYEEFLKDQDTCSDISGKIANSMIRVAATRIFADPTQSILELPVNSVDSYRKLRSSNAPSVGKFGMGFFSILYWVLQYPTVELYIQSQSRDSQSWCLKIYNDDDSLTAKFVSIQEVSFDEPHVGTTIYINDKSEDDTLFDMMIDGFYEQITKLRYIPDVDISWVKYGNVSKITNKITNNEAEDKILLTRIKEAKYDFKVEDWAGGITLNTLFTSLLIPSISTKTLATAYTENVGHRQHIETQIIRSHDKNSLHISVGHIIVAWPEKQSQDKRSYIYHIDFPIQTKVPVSRDDIIVETNTDEYNLMLTGFKQLVDQCIERRLDIQDFVDIIHKYAQYSKQPAIYDIVNKIEDYIIQRDDVIYVPDRKLAKLLSNDSSIKISHLSTVSLSRSIKQIRQYLLKRDDIILDYSFQRYTVVVLSGYTDRPTDGGLPSFIFISSQLYNQDNWKTSLITSYSTDILEEVIDSGSNDKWISSTISVEYMFKNKVLEKPIHRLTSGDITMDIPITPHNVSRLFNINIEDEQFQRVLTQFYNLYQITLTKLYRYGRNDFDVPSTLSYLYDAVILYYIISDEGIDEYIRQLSLFISRIQLLSSEGKNVNFKIQPGLVQISTRYQLLKPSMESLGRILPLFSSMKPETRSRILSGISDYIWPQVNDKNYLLNGYMLSVDYRHNVMISASVLFELNYLLLREEKNKLSEKTMSYAKELNSLKKQLEENERLYSSPEIDETKEKLRKILDEIKQLRHRSSLSSITNEEKDQLKIQRRQLLSNKKKTEKYLESLKQENINKQPDEIRKVQLDYDQIRQRYVNAIDRKNVLTATIEEESPSENNLPLTPQSLIFIIEYVVSRMNNSFEAYSWLMVLHYYTLKDTDRLSIIANQNILQYVIVQCRVNYTTEFYDNWKKRYPTRSFSKITPYQREYETEFFQPMSHRLELYTNQQSLPFCKSLSTVNAFQYNFTANQLIHYVFTYKAKNILNTVNHESLRGLFSRVQQHIIDTSVEFQSVSIAVNEGTSKPYVNSIITELLQNSIDAIRTNITTVAQRIDIDTCVEERQIQLRVQDYVGIPDTAILSLLIPFLSGKSTTDLMSTGEMGTGFFNVYRQPYTHFVDIITGDIHIRAHPILQGNRVVDIHYAVGISSNKIVNGTIINIHMNHLSDEDEINLLVDIHLTVEILGTLAPFDTYYNGQLKRGERTLLYEDEIGSVYVSSQKTIPSYLLTNGVPFTPLIPYANDSISFFYNNNNYALNMDLIIDINKGWYTPAQSRNRIRSTSGSNQVIEFIKLGLWYGLTYKIIHGDDLLRDMYLNQCSAETSIDQLVGYTGNTSKYFVDFQFYGSYQFSPYITIAFIIEDTINHLIESIDADKKIDEQDINDFLETTFNSYRDRLGQLNFNAGLIKQIIRIFFQNKRSASDVAIGTRKEEEKTKHDLQPIEAIMQRFVQVYYSIGRTLNISGVTFSNKPPKLYVRDASRSVNGYYNPFEHSITINDNAIDKIFLELMFSWKRIEELYTTKQISRLTQYLYLSPWSQWIGNIFPMSSLIHELQHSLRQDEHTGSSHGPSMIDGEMRDFNQGCQYVYERILAADFWDKMLSEHDGSISSNAVSSSSYNTSSIAASSYSLAI